MVLRRRAAPRSGGPWDAHHVVHVWRGWPVPVIGPAIARAIIGAVFVQGIAERTIAGLITAAEHQR